MSRHRQNSLNASPPSHGRGGTEKLKMSRREGMLLTVVVLLAVAICAIAFYKTGDPNFPRATGQQRRPGSQRTDELPESLSSQSKLIHRGKSFTDVNVIRTQEAGDMRLDDQAIDQVLIDSGSDTDDEQHGYDKETHQVALDDDDAVPVLASRNPYAHAQVIRSPDGNLAHGRHKAMPAASISSPVLYSSPALQTQSLPTSDPTVPVPVTVTQPVEQVSLVPTRQEDLAEQHGSPAHTQPGDPVHELEQPEPSSHFGNTSQSQPSAPAHEISAPKHLTDHALSNPETNDPSAQPVNRTSDAPVDRTVEDPKAVKKKIADKIKELQQQWHEEAVHLHDPSVAAVVSADKLHEHQSFIQDVLENGLPSDRPNPNGPSVSLHPIVRVNNLTTSEFEFRFASEFGLQPVVVSNSQNDWFSPEKFTIDELRRLIGSKPLRAQNAGCVLGRKAYDTNACHSIKESDPNLVGRMWASLKATNLTEIGVDTYDEFLTKQVELAKRGRYIYAHEISGGWLPEVEAIIRQPKYFLNNMQDLDWRPNVDISERISNTHFPSVFFGAAGSSSPLHSDARMTRFWIMQLAGKKLVRLVPPADNWRGDASDSHEFQPSLFTVDLMHPDFQEHPNMHNMIVYETILEPGDLLFIPEGWGHQALNLEWTWMISSNYIDEHNLPNLLKFVLYSKGPGEAYQEAQVDLDHFFLPINNPAKNLSNLALDEYFERLTLEYAPISDAAKEHCQILSNLEIPPDEWRDHHSKRVMTVAFETNYVALAQWLYEQGVPLENDLYGRTMLKWVMKNGMERMEFWMRSVMGVDESDKLEDIIDDEPEPKPEENQAKPTEPGLEGPQAQQAEQQPEQQETLQNEQPAQPVTEEEAQETQLDEPATLQEEQNEQREEPLTQQTEQSEELATPQGEEISRR